MDGNYCKFYCWFWVGDYCMDKNMKEETHILPINDIFPHKEEGIDCPCMPEIQSGNSKILYGEQIIIHNAWDKRK